MAHALLLHQLADLIQIVIRLAADDVLGHHFAHRAGGRIALLGDNATQHVALGEDSRHLSIVHHQKRAQLVGVHLLSGLQDRGGRGNGVNRCPFNGENILNSRHDAAPFEMSHPQPLIPTRYAQRTGSGGHHNKVAIVNAIL